MSCHSVCICINETLSSYGNARVRMTKSFLSDLNDDEELGWKMVSRWIRLFKKTRQRCSISLCAADVELWQTDKLNARKEADASDVLDAFLAVANIGQTPANVNILLRWEKTSFPKAPLVYFHWCIYRKICVLINHQGDKLYFPQKSKILLI